MTVPFTTEAAVNAGYAKIQDEGSFIGMANSAILCTHPVNYNAYYNESMVCPPPNFNPTRHMRVPDQPT